MGIYRCAAIGHTPGESFSFGVYFDGGISVELAAANTAWAAAVALLYSTNGPGGHPLTFYTHTSVGIDDTTVASIDPATNKQISKMLTAAAIVGTNATASLPPQTTMAISLRTDLATRKGRGRFYLPPFATDALSGGRILADARDTALAGAVAMLDHMQAALLTPLVWHKDDGTGTNVVRVDAGDVFDTQRRRRNKLVEARSSTSL